MTMVSDSTLSRENESDVEVPLRDWHIWLFAVAGRLVRWRIVNTRGEKPSKPWGCRSKTLLPSVAGTMLSFSEGPRIRASRQATRLIVSWR